ncbi:hypothetical protein DFH27DRAFT_177769 [Peziza echinospora]|nr:hypothetical protein DFH27DRAFT_177769 [Peziza echinospora]
MILSIFFHVEYVFPFCFCGFFLLGSVRSSVVCGSASRGSTLTRVRVGRRRGSFVYTGPSFVVNFVALGFFPSCYEASLSTSLIRLRMPLTLTNPLSLIDDPPPPILANQFWWIGGLWLSCGRVGGWRM